MINFCGLSQPRKYFNNKRYPNYGMWWNDSRGVLLSWDGTTPRESFYPEMERLQGSQSVLGWNDSRGVLPSQDRRPLGESFRHGIEQLQGSQSVLG